MSHLSPVGSRSPMTVAFAVTAVLVEANPWAWPGFKVEREQCGGAKGRVVRAVAHGEVLGVVPSR